MSRKMLSYLLVAILALAAQITPTNAAAGVGCDFFDYQDDAQSSLESYPAKTQQLDLDIDGIACNELPPGPANLAGAERMRGNFDRDAARPLLSGAGDSLHFKVELAFVSLVPPPLGSNACDDFPTSETVFTLFDVEDSARTSHLQSSDGSSPPIADKSPAPFRGLVWTVFDDPATPVLVNEWLIRNGLAYYVSDSVITKDEITQQTMSGQEAAKSHGIGV